MNKMTNFTFVKTLSVDEDLLWKDFIEEHLKDFICDSWGDYIDDEEVYGSLSYDDHDTIENKLYEDLLKKALDK